METMTDKIGCDEAISVVAKGRPCTFRLCRSLVKVDCITVAEGEFVQAYETGLIV